MASFGFMIHSISPAYSYNSDRNFEIQAGQSASAPVVANGVIADGYLYAVDGGYIYKHQMGSGWKNNWEKYKLP